MKIYRLELALKDAMHRKPFYFLRYLTMTKRNTAQRATTFTVEFDNSNSQANSKKAHASFTAWKLQELGGWSEFVGDNWQILPKWDGISVEDYDFVKQVINEWNEQAERLIEKLENSKPKVKKLGSKLENFTAFEENLDEVPENLLLIYQNQLSDLRKPDISLEHLASELTFYDFFMRIASWEPVNAHFIPFKNLQNLIKIWKEFTSFEENTVEDSENASPFRKSRDFKRVLGTEQTPNEKNYEKNLIQKLTFKRMLEEMELLDSQKLATIKQNLENIEYLEQQYREMIVDNWLSPKQQQIRIKKFKKEKRKIQDKTWKIEYYLRDKYGYMLEN